MVEKTTAVVFYNMLKTELGHRNYEQPCVTDREQNTPKQCYSSNQFTVLDSAGTVANP